MARTFTATASPIASDADDFQRGVVRALTGGGAEHGTLARYTERLPNGSALLAAAPEIEFSLPWGGAGS